MSTIRLMIVENQPIVLEGLRKLFDGCSDFEIAAAAQNHVEALEQLEQRAIDVALVEPAANGDNENIFSLYREIRNETALLVYSHISDEAAVYRTLKEGARGYILKSAPLDELLKAIRDVHHGHYALSPSLNPAIIEFYLQNRDRDYAEFTDYEHLTLREKQVFKLLVDGLQTREISDNLCISPKTVAKHRTSIKKKLDVQTPVQMAHYAMRIGLIQPEA